MYERAVGVPALPNLVATSMPGVELVAVHPDLHVLESNKLHGNTDPRFSALPEVQVSRTTLAAATDCEHLVVMVPQASDHYENLDSGRIVAPKEGYRLWPQELQPVEDVVYDPDNPPRMIDLPTDGLVTRRPGSALMLNTADCAATVIYDPTQKALALTHIGREGAILRIAPKIIEHLRRVYASQPADLVVHFGASIAPDSYVLPRLSEALRQEAWRPYLHQTEDGGFETDIVGCAIQQCLETGVQGTNVSRSPVDVATHPDYFSFTEHKRDGTPDGRNGLLAVIR